MCQIVLSVEKDSGCNEIKPIIFIICKQSSPCTVFPAVKHRPHSHLSEPNSFIALIDTNREHI